MTYYTPRFSGVQLGISYTPESTENLGAGFGTPVAGAGELPAISARSSKLVVTGTAALAMPRFVPLQVTLRLTVKKPSGATRNDLDKWTLAITISMNGWSLGAQYQNDETNGGAVTATNTQRDDISWRVGLSYATGAWVLGAEYFNREVDQTATASDEAEVWGVGAKRNLGAGVSAGIGVHIWDWQDDANAAAGENDATEFFFVTEISF